MDLSKYSVKDAASKGAFLHLKNPFDHSPIYEEKAPEVEGEEPIKVKVGLTLMGRDSDVVQSKLKEIERRRVKGEEISDTEASMEMLAAGTISWQGIAMPGTTEDAECTFENVLAVLNHPDTAFVGEQASVFAAVRRNFIGNVPTT